MARQDLVAAVRALGYNLTVPELASYEQWDVSHIPCVNQLAKTLGVTESWLLTGKPMDQGPRQSGNPELEVQLLEHWQGLDLKAKGIIVRMAAALAKVDLPPT
jgi:hypothetical protein